MIKAFWDGFFDGLTLGPVRRGIASLWRYLTIKCRSCGGTGMR